MFTEILCGVLVGCVILRIYVSKTRPKHYKFAGDSFSRCAYDEYLCARDARRDGTDLFSQSMVNINGFDILYNYVLNETDLIRRVLSLDQVQGHMEMKGFWDVMCHYRKLTKKRDADRLTEEHIGVLTELNPTHARNTSVMKLSRRRFLEFTSSPKQYKVNVEKIRGEAEDLVDCCLKASDYGKVGFNPQPYCMDATVNTGFRIAVGYCFKQGTPEMRKAAETVASTLSELIAPFPKKLLLILLPKWLREWIPLKYWPEMCWKNEYFWEYLLDCIEKHDKSFNDDDDHICLLDTLQHDYRKGAISFSDIFHSLQVMLISAADTTAMNSSIVFHNLARFPEWQEKAYREAAKINFTATKWDAVPTLGAFMYESIRWIPTLHRNLFHSTTVPFKLNGYTFKKDSIFSFSYAGICMDPQYFPDPFKFDPTRFLDANGNLTRQKNLMPFGYGKRSCPGQSIAELQMLSFVLNLLSKAEVCIDPEKPLLNPKNEEEWGHLFRKDPLHYFQGFMMAPANMNIIMKPRN